MRDQVFLPSERLKPFIQCYWTCRHPEDVLEVMYPSGSIELCIDISDGGTIRHRGNQSMRVPRLELLGHWTIPTRAAIAKGNTCLITRFDPHAASLFFQNPASDFTNESVDLCDIFNKHSSNFYDRLMEQSTLQQKIIFLEEFLTERLVLNKKSHQQLKLVESLCKHVYSRHDFFDIRDVSARFGFSERYIQKLFCNWVGITPQKYFAVRRFNKSLELVRSSEESLTAIAFQCGYYDQAHFIKEFKSYTGLTPGEVKML
ncbi:AraC family transcriptional regulator [Mucilaginibacter sp. L3T2-6]|uniref:helix-turn-helix domain-containing protein n=1 Tax=Mucilaginibacter sp. L3T2-6 TaxID=3062491 RepID=UPI00267534F9|nr:helix-turn-helix transcriptional regulator [Mucilaginibacter sp. L3T2-6]MDO3645051.1 helix-turn-helix transcriptional regulator [Mucilaginibacter sp. L3T2-6]MDV6217502.1 helix-turn-helix transcriptional regulator [Mucilaginibacter sp. L3T2-6]